MFKSLPNSPDLNPIGMNQKDFEKNNFTDFYNFLRNLSQTFEKAFEKARNSLKTNRKEKLIFKNLSHIVIIDKEETEISFKFTFSKKCDQPFTFNLSRLFSLSDGTNAKVLT
ncbi:hypothetical protein BpHYR1_003013 [Brachionus plicatilis]|uniref:Uncharacterized protein n=1 Tax=Brachionus plicatilis TaxID=10195 RepID=A0A3M7S4T6_BRAPC|nr:hypothetical protein BpHYR1_003013 [Brachionus plicatilis]